MERAAALAKQLTAETKMGDLRKIAKEIKKDHQLALALWLTGSFKARLLAILIMDKNELTEDKINELTQQIASHPQSEQNQLMDWLFANQLAKSRRHIRLLETWQTSELALQRRIYWYYQGRLRWMGNNLPENTEEILTAIETTIMEEVPEDFERAWKYLTDEKHFTSPYGYTYTDQSHPKFQISYEGHPCTWDGPVWPMASSCTLTAMSNLLHDHKSEYITAKDFCDGLKKYAESQFIEIDGEKRPWIDEVQNPFTGDWISRTMLRDMGAPDWERGKDYNHSSFCDLIISGLVGLRVNKDGYKVEPLCKDSLEWFTLDGVMVKGSSLSISWDNETDKVIVNEYEAREF